MYGNHFTFEELTSTETGLYNIPVIDTHLANLANVWNTLNYIREKFDRPIIVNSGFRSPEVNKQVGGSKRSLHMQGRAADITCKPEYLDELWALVYREREWLSECIKYPTFIHIAI